MLQRSCPHPPFPLPSRRPEKDQESTQREPEHREKALGREDGVNCPTTMGDELILHGTVEPADSAVVTEFRPYSGHRGEGEVAIRNENLPRFPIRI